MFRQTVGKQTKKAKAMCSGATDRIKDGFLLLIGVKGGRCGANLNGIWL